MVSSVFGKQFSKSQASSGEAMSRFTAAIVASTAGLVKRRSPTGGRRVGRPGTGFPAKARRGMTEAAAARAAVRRAWRRVVMGTSARERTASDTSCATSHARVEAGA